MIKKIVPECDTCDGFCCKYFIIPIKIVSGSQGEDYKKWLSYHNIKLIFHRGKHIIRIKAKCKYLLDNGKCSIFNSPLRLIMCDIADCPKKDKEYIRKINENP